MTADELKHFEETFRRYGFSDNDFSIAGKMDKALSVKEQHAAYLDEEVTVICHKTGKSTTYRSGHDTNWVAEFEQDLLNSIFSVY